MNVCVLVKFSLKKKIVYVKYSSKIHSLEGRGQVSSTNFRLCLSRGWTGPNLIPKKFLLKLTITFLLFISHQ
jgi:hypothetical protein